MSPLDRIDHAILAALQNDARLSNKELAARVGLAPSSCLERVRRLRREGVLQGAHFRVEPAALGIGLQAMIFVQLDAHRREQVEAFDAHLRALAEVVGAWYIGGADDYLVHVAVRDAAHLRDLALDAFSGRPEVRRIRTEIVFADLRRAAWPDYAAGA